MSELLAAEAARAGRLAQLLGDLSTVAALAWLAYLLPGSTAEAALPAVDRSPVNASPSAGPILRCPVDGSLTGASGVCPVCGWWPR